MILGNWKRTWKLVYYHRDHIGVILGNWKRKWNLGLEGLEFGGFRGLRVQSFGGVWGLRA